MFDLQIDSNENYNKTQSVFVHENDQKPREKRKDPISVDEALSNSITCK